MLSAIMQVIGFEVRRTRTRGRIGIWLALAIFPSLLLTLLRLQVGRPVPDEALAMMAFYLVVQIGCMMGLLLWATPVVGSELESQTWIYLALRPHGKTAILMGKYVVAALWTASAGVVSAVGVAFCSGHPTPWTLATTLLILVLVSSVCYAALYVLIGVVFSARATVVAVIYTLLFEGILSTIPATINKFTVCYRLRSLLSEWVDLVEVRTTVDELFGHEPAWQHLVCLAIFTLVALCIALVVVRYKEFPVSIDA